MKNIIHSATATTRSLVSLGALLLTAGALAGCSTAQAEPTNLASGSNCATLDKDAAKSMYDSGKLVDAKPIEERIFKARAIQPEKTMGATLYVKADEGMTAPYLHRVASCHAASQDAAHPNDPLHPESGEIAKIEVREAKGAFAVDVRADDPRVGKEIWQRAESLTHGGSVNVEQLATQADGQSQF